MENSFQIARTPYLIFGPGSRMQLPALAGRCGRKILLLTGSKSLEKSGFLVELKQKFRQADCIFKTAGIQGEPSPDLIDQLVQEFRSWKPDLVIAVGGGSVLDLSLIHISEPTRPY